LFVVIIYSFFLVIDIWKLGRLTCIKVDVRELHSHVS
jgi:hypothetical protein